MTDALKLIARDPADIPVLSAILQDAVMTVGDIAFLPTERRFAMVMNRFRWEGDGSRRRRPASGERVRSGLHFDFVLEASTRNLPRGAKGQILSLLAIRHEPAGDDSYIHFDFSGDAGIRLRVEVIEAHLTDISEPWAAVRKPAHALD